MHDCLRNEAQVRRRVSQVRDLGWGEGSSPSGRRIRGWPGVRGHEGHSGTGRLIVLFWRSVFVGGRREGVLGVARGAGRSAWVCVSVFHLHSSSL